MSLYIYKRRPSMRSTARMLHLLLAQKATGSSEREKSIAAKSKDKKKRDSKDQLNCDCSKGRTKNVCPHHRLPQKI